MKSSEQDKRDMEAMLEAVREWGKREVTLTADIGTTCTLIGSIQLTCRHPHCPSHVKRLMTQLVNGLIDGIADINPVLATYLQRGWHECYDDPEQGATTPPGQSEPD